MIRRLAKNAWDWFDDRTGVSKTIWPIMTHLVPPGATWWYVFGSATLCAFAVQVVSGVVLAMSYVPSAESAYESLQYITNEAQFGSFMRGMHYWGAGTMVLMVGIHMTQVFLSGAFKFPRELTWLSGIVLLGLVLGMAFTGQLLRWDQNAIWSVILAAEAAGRAPFVGDWIAQLILGGETLGGATLSRFYVIHVFVIPGLMITMIGAHLYLVLRNGISEPPVKGKPVDPETYREEYEEEIEKHGVPFFPDSAWRDVVFALGVVLAIACAAFFIGPPTLDPPPDPSVIEAQPRPDWYFLWMFAIMALMPAGLENFAIIFGPVFVGSVLIGLPFIFGKGERHPARRPWAVGVVIVTFACIGGFWLAGVRSNWSPNFKAEPLSAEIVGVETGPVAEGAVLFHAQGCLNCHLIDGKGGRRGPNLTDVGDRLTHDAMVIRVMNGGHNMPAFASILTPDELERIVAFLQSRTLKKISD